MKNFKPLFFLFVILLAGLPLFADKGAIPGRDYSVFVGLGEQPVVSGNETKEKIDRLPPVPQVKEAAPVEESIDLTNAVILKQIQKAKKPASQTQKGGDLITLPAKFEKEMSQYYATLAEKAAASAAVPVPSAEQLLLLQCKTFKDYKINNNTNMKMICHKPNDKSVSYKLSANLAVAERELVSIPYMLEDDSGNVFTVEQTKSKLFNAASGSANLATFVDKRAIEQVNKAMAGTFATSGPELTKDYIEQKNKADTEVVQNNNGLTTTTTQQTINPKPEASDYGISLLVDVLGSGIKAGVDQLYLDLGYIYYVPKDSVIDAEIVIKVEK